MRSAVLGVTSDILIITRLPAANAAEAGSTTRLSGKFHGPMIPTTPNGDGCTSARRPNIRAARMSRVVRIHCGTFDLVCSITEIMPRISVNNVPARGRVPKSAAMASTNASALSSTSPNSRSMRLRRTATLGGPSATNACR